MAAGAFSQAQSSMRWFIDNFSAIADWRANLLRVANFRYVLMRVHEPIGFTSSISYAEGPAGMISIDGLEIVSSANTDKLLEERVVIESGERVLILGAPGTGKTQLFRALAGLWPWGQGRIVRPAGEQVFYLPRGTPYMPRGTLREVLAYPQKAENFTDAAFKRSLFRLGLERLASLLDATDRWDRELSQDEQLSLAVARILLQSPPWILVDGTFGLLDDDVLEVLIDIFNNELKETAVIHIGSPALAHPMFTRTLHLVKATRRAAAAVADKAPGSHA
jgi:putative ATP-binding cassette transporter